MSNSLKLSFIFVLLTHFTYAQEHTIENETSENAVTSDWRRLANEFAARSVRNYGCQSFSEYFRSDLEPRLVELQKMEETPNKMKQMKNLIWDYSQRRYKKFNLSYEQSSKAIISIADTYLMHSPLDSETNENIKKLLSEIESQENRKHLPCESIDQTVKEADSVENLEKEETLPWEQQSTRSLLNHVANLAVSGVGCENFKDSFQEKLRAPLEALRSRQDYSSSRLKNIVWDYAFRKFQAHNQAYEMTTESLISIFENVIEQNGEIKEEELSAIISEAKKLNIQCGKESKPKTEKTSSGESTPTSQAHHSSESSVGEESHKPSRKKIPLPVTGQTPGGNSWTNQLHRFDNEFSNRSWGSSLNEIIDEKFEQGHLNSLLNIRQDLVNEFCPRYSDLDKNERKDFWKVFFKALAYGESGYDINSGPKSGIFQLTCDKNARRFYKCNCNSNQDLIDDRRLNLDCAANIVNYWAKRDQLIQDSRTKSTYFEALLRNNSSYKNNVKKQLLKNQPKFCTNRE